jgi:dihydroorotate dehydrogenase
MYQLLRKILFLFDAEKVHYFSMNMLVFLCKFSLIKKIIKRRFTPHNNHLFKNLFGLNFSNPVGLAAGFD